MILGFVAGRCPLIEIHPRAPMLGRQNNGFCADTQAKHRGLARWAQGVLRSQASLTLGRNFGLL